MEQTEQDRTEDPTPFKLMRARRQGSVARGADLGFLVSLTAFFGGALILGAGLLGVLGEDMRAAFVSGPLLAEGASAPVTTAGRLLATVATPVAAMAIVIFATVLLFELLQTGFVFSAKPLTPDFTRLNPARGLKRIFSLRLLVETLKNVLKLVAYASIGYLVISASIRYAQSVAEARGLYAAMGHMTVRLVAAVIGLAILFAIIDQLIVRRDFLKRMRMSRRELRREVRDREGEPRLKQKRKQMHAQFVRLAQSVRNLRGADVLIVNPQHLAVALRYDRRTMIAPHVVTMGLGDIALRLKRLAFIYNIPAIENRALAWEIYRKSGLEKPIPEACYRRVADIYNDIRKNAVRPAIAAPGNAQSISEIPAHA